MYSPIAAVLLLILPAAVHAKTFSNSFLSFTLPDSWVCVQEGVAWACSNKGPNQANEAVIVMAAKVAAPQDTLASFKDFLQKPKTIPTRVGTPMPSAVMYAQERVLANTKWIQAQHIGSEVQDFYTLYIATVKDQLAILVSFSADKTKYAFFNPVFDQAMKSLKLTATNQLVFPKNSGAGGIAVFGITGDTANPEMLPPPAHNRRGSYSYWLVLAAVGALLGVGAYALHNPKKPK
jgi:hypothetical protein